ncbi:MAG: IclR family transcriptional regulator [Variovorax sp.]|nr:IclR family transcriptional regulator [Variovorax sp.]
MPVTEKAPETGGATVQAVGVAFSVFAALAASGEPLGITELARRLGETKARVHRHLQTLRELGYADQDSSGAGYRLGWRAWRLAQEIQDNFQLRRVASGYLRALHEETHHTVALGVMAGPSVAVIDAIQAPGSIAITIRPGSLIPAPTSAMGRSMLAFLPKEVRAEILAQPSSALTPQTVLDTRAIDELLARIESRRYAVAVNERLPGVSALAVPVFDDREAVVATLAVIASSTELTDPPPLRLLAQVQAAASQLSQGLGSKAWSTFHAEERAPA